MNSIHLGWSPFFENQLASGDRSRYSVGRILEARKNCYVLLTDDGRFTDCGHRAGTPGCSVQAAIESGALSPDRVASWFKVGRELAFLARRQDKKAQSEEKKRWKAIALANRKRYDDEVNL